MDIDGHPRFVDDPNTIDTGQGQAPVVDMGAYEFAGGFPGDCDSDGDIDLVDFATFQLCFTGPGADMLPPTCTCVDLDNDSDVDLVDFNNFQLAFTGPQ